MASIYLDPVDFGAVQYLKSHDFYERDRDRPPVVGGYCLNPNGADYQALPPDAEVVVPGGTSVQFPGDLRFPIFEDAPGLPPGFLESLRYWGREPQRTADDGAKFYQPPEHAYMVSLEGLDGEGVVVARGTHDDHLEDDPGVHDIRIADRLVSDGFVARIGVEVPPDASYGSFLRVGFRYSKTLLQAMGVAIGEAPAEEFVDVTIYLRVSDYLSAPIRPIYVDLMRYELMDYGYFY